MNECLTPMKAHKFNSFENIDVGVWYNEEVYVEKPII